MKLLNQNSKMDQSKNNPTSSTNSICSSPASSFSSSSSTPFLMSHKVINKYKIVDNIRGSLLSRVLNRSMDPRTYEQQQPLIAQLPQVPLLPQQIITSGTRKDCIRLRGLPFEAQVEHILEFLGEHAKSIVYQGVHMVYNAHGQPSGEAFIQMDSEHSAFLASQQRHHRYMVFGKKQRYIEVFQCSGEDMNMVLTGGLPTQRPVMSPGMLMWDTATLPGGIPHPLSVPPPGTPRPQGPHLLGAAHHPLHPPTHGPMIPGIPPSPLKQADTPLLLPPPMGPPPPRPSLVPQSPLELPHSSQAPPTLMPPPLKPAESGIHTPLLGQYGQLPVTSQISTGSNPVFLLSNARTSLASGLHPQVTLVPVSTSQARDAQGAQGIQKAPVGPPLLPMPYAAAAAAAMAGAARLPGTQKRSFEQAFPGDAGAASIGAMKRGPHVNPSLLHPLYPPPQMFSTM